MLNPRSLIKAGPLLCGVTIFFSITFTANAATYSSASPKVADIQAKLNLARDGDVVNVPAGVAQWTAPLQITKNITVRGAGVGQTVIYDQVPRTPQSYTLQVVLSKNLPFRLSGFEFRGDPSVTQPNVGGVIHFRGMQGVTSNFRLDHCKFTG